MIYLKRFLKLTSLTITGTRIDGNIPKSISCLSHLQVLNLSYNALSGKLPFDFGNLQELQTLDLRGNKDLELGDPSLVLLLRQRSADSALQTL